MAKGRRRERVEKSAKSQEQRAIIYKHTISRAFAAKLSRTGCMVLLAMMEQAYYYSTTRRECRQHADRWLKDNYTDKEAKKTRETLQVVSMSQAQLKERLGTNSNNAIRRGLNELEKHGILIRIYRGARKHPACWVVAPFEETSSRDEWEPEDETCKKYTW